MSTHLLIFTREPGRMPEVKIGSRSEVLDWTAQAAEHGTVELGPNHEFPVPESVPVDLWFSCRIIASGRGKEATRA